MMDCSSGKYQVFIYAIKNFKPFNGLCFPFLSNVPGDPSKVTVTDHLKIALQEVRSPIFGKF